MDLIKTPHEVVWGQDKIRLTYERWSMWEGEEFVTVMLRGRSGCCRGCLPPMVCKFPIIIIIIMITLVAYDVISGRMLSYLTIQQISFQWKKRITYHKSQSHRSALVSLECYFKGLSSIWKLRAVVTTSESEILYSSVYLHIYLRVLYVSFYLCECLSVWECQSSACLWEAESVCSLCLWECVCVCVSSSVRSYVCVCVIT